MWPQASLLLVFFSTNVGLAWRSILFCLKHHREQKWCSPTVTWFFFYISTERQHQRSTNHFVSHTLSKVRMAKRLDRRRSCCAIGKEAAPSWKAVPWFKRRALWQDLSNNQKKQLFSNRLLYRDFFPDYISNVQPMKHLWTIFHFFGKKKFDHHFLYY